jgi:hypothetical protein
MAMSGSFSEQAIVTAMPSLPGVVDRALECRWSSVAGSKHLISSRLRPEVVLCQARHWPANGRVAKLRALRLPARGFNRHDRVGAAACPEWRNAASSTLD